MSEDVVSGRAAALAATGKRERAIETDRGGPEAEETDAAGRVKKSSEGTTTPAVREYVAGRVSRLGAARLCDRIFAPLGLSLAWTLRAWLPTAGGVRAATKDRDNFRCRDDEFFQA